MKKLTFALSAGAALVAATVGLAAPALATPSTVATAQYAASSVAAAHAPFPQDCGVHVLYQGSVVDVQWC